MDRPAHASLATAQSTRQVKRRATIACRHCSMRKVRCNVAISGQPCANCVHDNIICDVVPHRKRRGRPRVVSTPSEETSEYSAQAGRIPVHQQFTAIEPNVIHSVGGQPEAHTAASSLLPSPQSVVTGENSISNVGNLSDEGESRDAFAQVLDASPRPPDRGLSSLFYCGNGQGLNGFLFDFDGRTGMRKETHFLIPPPSSNDMLPQEVAYLESMGAYQLPAGDICEHLLRCYFRNVHQLLPILDVVEILEEYHQNGFGNISLLLLWSMFFASSNFVDPMILREAGFESRKAMKRAFYRRAKVLHDLDYEKDKVILIQSLLLMGLWYVDANDRNGAWHWIGIAIGLAQSIGLHRRLRLANPSYPISKRQESVYRRIWWSCLIRDRWLSLATGRPMRINANDCDVAEPSASDISEELNTMSSEFLQDYIPYNPDILANLWLQLVKISTGLGSVLQTHYRVRGKRAGILDLQKTEEEVESCRPSRDENGQCDPMIQLFACQLHLFFEATIIVLFRPYLVKGPSHPDVIVEQHWQRKSLQKVRSAAANTSRTLETLLEMDLVRYMKSMAITSLIPAMQIHLLDCKSPNPLVRKFAGQKLDLCMLAVSQLRQTYWGADFTYRLFQKAQSKISPELVAFSLPSSLNRMEADQDANQYTVKDFGIHGTGDVISNVPCEPSGETMDGRTTSVGDESDEAIQWLLNSEDFTNLFLQMTQDSTPP